MAKVIFHVGQYHPLFNKIVDANIIQRGTKTQKFTIIAETKREVYFPFQPHGTIILDDYGEIIGRKPREAYTKKWKGVVKQVLKE